MTHRRWSRALLGISLTAGALAVPPAPFAHASPPPGGLDQGGSWKVTLLTGDVVDVRTVKGKPPLVSVTPAPGREKRSFRKEIRPDGHVVVTPTDVSGLVGRVIDPRLFDVTTLIAQRYDDARSEDVRLIVQRAPGSGSPKSLGGTFETTRELPSLGAVAVRQPKREARRLGAALAGMPSARSTGDIRHIWLDGRVEATFSRTPATLTRTPAAPSGHRLDRNLEQVGAPAAWKAGFTGKGAKVAVLDSGVDAGHPDLQGRIAESKNFSEAADTVDRVGHGTHVASTIAGTGAASHGERRGVAPDASLLVGKVLDDDGFGTDSGVIAGMEWAAPRAGVVNMSLGGDATDGTDPLSTALNGLTKKYGTLFVVSAGNEGLVGSVGTPGTADTALTVGAVDDHDGLAEFSSRGPRGHAAKPEIVAPGVDTIAARAEGTSMGTPIGAEYTKSSGTSMAAPHVAAAAALLAARHPDWKAPRLKAALVGTAAPATGGDVYERGAGRLDAGAAVLSPVLAAQSVVDLGTSRYPEHGALSTKLAWTSTASKPVSLGLSVEVVDRHGRKTDGVASLQPSAEVPAGGTGSASLAVDASKLAARPGLYTAVVTAKGGGAALGTPVTFYVEPPAHTLTVKATPLPGTDPANFGATATVVNMKDMAVFSQWVDVPGTAEVRVPDGVYAVLGNVDDFSGWRSALVGDPEVVVEGDTAVTLDGAAAVPMKASVEGVEAEQTTATMDLVRDAGQGLWAYSVYSSDPGAMPVYAQPMGGVRTGTFHAYTGNRLTGPGTVYDVVRPLGDGIPADLTQVVTPADVQRMARVEQRFAAFDGDPSIPMSEKRYGISPEGLLSFEGSDWVKPGTTRTDYVSTDAGWLWGDEAFVKFGEDLWVDQGGFTALKAGERTSNRWGRQPLRPGPLSGTAVTPSGCNRYPTTRTGRNIRVSLVDLQTRPDGFDCDIHEVRGRHLELFDGDRKIGEKDGPFGDFTVPAGTGDYRLTYENDASALLPVSTHTFTSWRFRSRQPRGHGSAGLPLLLVDYDLKLDLNNQPAGEPAEFTVARMAGSGTAKVTGLEFWTSVDDGGTWQAAQVKPLGGGRFSAPLPAPAKGQAVSLRVSAKDAGGSGIEQRVLRAYRVR
ncbi:S8 family serine peptidase [Actinomadura sp. NEAU-AAG7]|uniref:S8 family serine peptidase n=1 Tax=Actinomadura sp. NEAU-AAG7 TaxID=2839640 RepID=UPI001BE4898F|nr:S8 family serine peptidase [Actinomadura sp. NEAU-AAG7]MBT2206718.1 S8 family serine peptidase [Actinomadura sp. NEAU-AAG7]